MRAPRRYIIITNPYTFGFWIPGSVLENFSDIWGKEWFFMILL